MEKGNTLTGDINFTIINKKEEKMDFNSSVYPLKVFIVYNSVLYIYIYWFFMVSIIKCSQIDSDLQMDKGWREICLLPFAFCCKHDKKQLTGFITITLFLYSVPLCRFLRRKHTTANTTQSSIRNVATTAISTYISDLESASIATGDWLGNRVAKKEKKKGDGNQNNEN